MDAFEKSLNDFLDSPKRNDWIGDDKISVYVRKGLWPKNSLHIANIEAEERGKGNWKRIWPIIFKVATERQFSVIKIENVLNPRFEVWFQKQNWSKVEDLGGIKSYFLVLKPEDFLNAHGLLLDPPVGLIP